LALGALAAICTFSAAQQHDQSFMHVDQGLQTRHHNFHLASMHAATQKKKDNTVHHAAMHAEHWLDHHSSAPHGKAYQHRAAKRKHNVNHAIKHTEHWIDHHASAPHKTHGK
jgi:hypothetical protein